MIQDLAFLELLPKFLFLWAIVKAKCKFLSKIGRLQVIFKFCDKWLLHILQINILCIK